MLFLLERKVLEHLAAARVPRDLRRPRVELEPAALGRNRNPQGVAREHQVRVAGPGGGRRTPRPAFLARSVDLHDALRRCKAAGAGDFLDQRLDVGAEELEGAVAALADEMKMTRLTVGVLEAEPPLAEVDLSRDARIDHPLERPVDRGAADALVFAANQIDEIVGAEMSFLAEK